MAKTLCPVCKRESERLDERRRGDHHWFSCPRCGLYQIGGSFAATLEHEGPQAVLSGAIRHAAERGEPLGMIDQWKAKELEASAPRTIPDKSKQLLRVLQKRAPNHGQMATLNVETDTPLAYGEDGNALRFILEHLSDEGLVRGNVEAGVFVGYLTAKGWSLLEQGEHQGIEAINSPMTSFPSNKHPKAFISYSWDSEDHRAWVRELAARLRQHGVDVTLDQWEVAPGDQLPRFMETSIRENDFVLIVLTPNYKQKSDSRLGGVGYEGDIMTGEVFAGKDPRKFIPILRAGTWPDATPSWLGGKYGLDLKGDPFRQDQYEDLLSTLHGTRKKAPAIGKRPVSPSRPITNDPPVPCEPICILGIIANEVGTPRNDGTRGSALYRVPFQLSSQPSEAWALHFVETWDHPPSYSGRHRPRIAHVEGDRIVLDGTTIEEVAEVHRDTLKLVVETVNKDIAEDEARRRRLEEMRAEQARQHRQAVEDAARKINFD